MWKDYASGYVRNNRASSISVMAASFVSALLLSLLCSLFYNLWFYEIERLKAEEGDWQGRIVGEICAEDLERIQNYANVKRAVINEELSNEKEIAADIYFKNMRSIFTDLPRIVELTDIPQESVSYHYALLNMYLIRDANDPALRWVFPFLLMIAAISCFSLILIIQNAFAVTMNARVHQFGIFSSIGASPRQIRTCLLQEAAALCTLPIAAGSLFGIVISMGIVEGINVMMADAEGRLKIPFSYHPLILVLSLLAAALTVWISAWIPAKKISRMTPLAAIKSTDGHLLKRKKNFHILPLLFGIEGVLAGNALKAQKKSMRTATLSLVFSFLAFSLMMCFLTIVMISQRETYFERYQDAWDVMAELKNTEIDDVQESDALQSLLGVESGIVYQKAKAKRIVRQEELSEELRVMGGFANALPEYVSAVGEAWLVNAPLVILDDVSFLIYCTQIGAEPRLDGAVIRNKTVDSTDSNFRNRRVLPYLTETMQTTVLCRNGQENTTAELPVIAYTDTVPNLREEYGTLDFYELVHFMPVSAWKKIKEQIGGAEEDVKIRILAKDETALEGLNKIEEETVRLFGKNYEIKTENRIQEELDNNKMFRGMVAVLSIFCILLAAIGIGNVFSNTFGFVQQRKREFARYMSVGLTPAGMKKMFCVEMLVIAGRPVFITLPVTVLAVVFFVQRSYLEPALFMHEAPWTAILIFILAVFAAVALAYYFGAKKVLACSLADALTDDSLI